MPTGHLESKDRTIYVPTYASTKANKLKIVSIDRSLSAKVTILMKVVNKILTTPKHQDSGMR